MSIFFSSVCVAASINLHCEAQLIAKEINNVFVQWFLSVKIVPEHLLPLQMLPQNDFRTGRAITQFASALL